MKVDSFVYNSNSSRVVFGEGSSLKLDQYLRELNCKKAIIITGQTQAKRAKTIFKYLNKIVKASPKKNTIDKERRTGIFFIGPNLQKSISLCIES